MAPRGDSDAGVPGREFGVEWPLLACLPFPQPGIGASRYFITVALHPEPPGRRAAPPSLARRRVPTGTPTPRHPRLGEQLGPSLKEAGQVGGGGAKVFGVQRGCGSIEGESIYNVARTRHWGVSCFKVSPEDI